MTLKTELEINDGSRRWTKDVALNAELKSDGSSERRNWKCDMITLKVELEMNDDSKRQTEDVALNAKLKMWHDDSEWWTKTMALNTKLNMRFWTPNWKCDMMTLNEELKPWLWTPNWRCNFEHQTKDATLNANRKRDMTALNVELKMQGDNEGEICPSVTYYYNSQSMEMAWNRLYESQMMLC